MGTEIFLCGWARRVGLVASLVFCALIPIHRAFSAGDTQPTRVSSKEPHDIQLLDTPAFALRKFLDEIESTDSSLDLNYYSFYFCDKSARMILTAVQKKVQEAKADGRPYPVRMLLDFYEFSYLSEGALFQLVEELRSRGIELRFFNPSSYLSYLHPITQNQRDHQKRLIGDRKRVIIGGRLPGDAYFGMDPGFNRIDKDVWIDGPIVGSMAGHFDQQWNHELTFNKFRPMPLSHSDKEWLAKTLPCLAPLKPDPELEDRLKWAGKWGELESPVMTVPEVVAGFDYPGYASKAKTFVQDFFQGEIRNAQESVLYENQYFIPRGESEATLQALGNKTAPIDVEVLSNSHYSGDDINVDRLTIRKGLEYQYTPINVRAFKGHVDEGNPNYWFPGTDRKRWQIHSKAVVIDRKHSWIGSNNLDPRSDNINLESGVLIPEHRPFAERLESAIRVNLDRSVRVAESSPELNCLLEDRSNMSYFDWLSSYYYDLRARLFIDLH